ncbi:Leucine rich repeat containing protein BspA family protein [Entamoeba marina]
MNYTKKLDSYSMLIVSKYLKTKNDFINLICVCKKFKETTEKLRFNPISIKSLKLFPNIQTQYLYNEDDIKIEGIDNYEISYRVNYDQLDYDNNIPEGATIIDDIFFVCDYDIVGNMEFYEIQLIIPITIKELGYACFSNCFLLTSNTLPSSLTSLGNDCFYGCSLLKSINLPSRLISLSSRCFSYCSSLISINIPSTVTSLGDRCFKCCSCLKKINGMENLKIRYKCFYKCDKLKNNPTNSNYHCVIS